MACAPTARGHKLIASSSISSNDDRKLKPRVPDNTDLINDERLTLAAWVIGTAATLPGVEISWGNVWRT